MKKEAFTFAVPYDTIKKSLYHFLILSLFCLSLTRGYAAYADLVDFTGNAGVSPGANPRGSLLLDNGVLYGMTEVGGANGRGVIFSYNPAIGTYTDLVDFTGNAGDFPGANPFGSLLLDNGVLYGMTEVGGANMRGVIFSYNLTTGTYTDLVAFTGNAGAFPGAFPFGSLLLDNRVLYGMTEGGGANMIGVIFSYDPATSTYTDLVDFTGSAGAFPFGSLLLDNGVLYGMTEEGGANMIGVIFSYNPATGTYTDLVDFTGNAGDFPGANPHDSLIIDNGVLYGMTQAGGAHGNGVIFFYNPATGTYTDLVDFTGNAGDFPGANPRGSLIIDNGVLYGMTQAGGAHGNGVIFSYNLATGTYTDLVDFTGNAGDFPGANPFGSLLLDNGVLYGMTAQGGANGRGVIFSYILPVANLTGHQKKNEFRIAFERFNQLKWRGLSSTGPEGVQGYFVYRNGVKIATLSNTTFEYKDHDREKGVTTSYSVTAFDTNGNQSLPQTVTIR